MKKRGLCLLEQEPQKKRQRTPLLLESRTSPAMVLTKSEKSIEKSYAFPFFSTQYETTEYYDFYLDFLIH